MKRIFVFIFFTFSIISTVYSNGVAIVDGENQVYLKLISSEVEVNVENQVAVITSTLTFKNELTYDTTVIFGFPMPEEASATSLRWLIEGQWYEATIGVIPDTGQGGSNPHQNLLDHLGETPLYFPIDQTVQVDSFLTVELSYVQLLPYSWGNVDFYYPNDYHLIQTSIVVLQELDFNLNSSRIIDSLNLLSNHPIIILEIINNYVGHLLTQLYEQPAVEDYHVQYTLSLDDLGLFSFSTLIPDSLLPDTFGGFFLFVAEPDPGDEVIDKVFTFIIDRSGSMGGNKIVQARDAATFIVNNMNTGDKFNIVDFASNVSSFRNEHVDYTVQSRDSALAYIALINATGSTNISGAFDVAVPQFNVANDSTANIIIFFTDGQATAGITNTTLLLEHVHALICSTETEICLFTFGIGTGANQQLLTLLASQNNGLSEFVGSADLFEKISQFYLKIRNPVLINTQISFTNPYISEIYPDPLPNLYKGTQMIVSGRYLEAIPTVVTLSGTAFGDTVSYDFNLELADSIIDQYQFSTKIWAKFKIEHLLIEYYSLDTLSAPAQLIKQEIIDLSINYGVLCPWTGFQGPGSVEEEEIEEIENNENIFIPYEILAAIPNRNNTSITIRFKVNININTTVKIKIYNSIGQLIKVLTIPINGQGIYEVLWDYKTSEEEQISYGVYFYLIDFEDAILGNKLLYIE